jgi:hypothetical protein
MFNQILLEQGFAAVFQKYPFKYKELFLESENKAKILKYGIWKEGDYPEITVSEAGQYIGKLARVRFRCQQITKSRKFLSLEAFSGKFSAVIPQEKADDFPKTSFLQGQTLLVTGLLEEYRGDLQIVAGISSQIRITNENGPYGCFSLLYRGCLGIIPP